MEWSEDLSVKVLKLDKQHQKIVRILNNTHDAMRAGQTREGMIGLLLNLKAYVLNHFDAEEQLLHEHGCPMSEAYKAEHKRFADTVQKYEKTLASGGSINAGEVMEFLRTWVVDHIGKVNQEFGQCLADRGAK
jgi:hemerythrin-like metal-binding protein